MISTDAQDWEWAYSSAGHPGTPGGGRGARCTYVCTHFEQRTEDARWATSVTSAACRLSAPAFADPPLGVYSMTGVV